MQSDLHVIISGYHLIEVIMAWEQGYERELYGVLRSSYGTRWNFGENQN